MRPDDPRHLAARHAGRLPGASQSSPAAPGRPATEIRHVRRAWPGFGHRPVEESPRSARRGGRPGRRTVCPDRLHGRARLSPPASLRRPPPPAPRLEHDRGRLVAGGHRAPDRAASLLERLRAPVPASVERPAPSRNIATSRACGYGPAARPACRRHVRIRGPGLGQCVVAVIPDHDQTQVAHRRENRAAGADDQPCAAPQRSQPSPVAG